jgi:SAM-dependent methyltransferase
MPDQDFKATPRQARIHYGNIAAPESSPRESVSDQALSDHDRIRSFVAPFPPEPAPSPVALLVCHGMGQQVRFETIGQIAASLLKYAEQQQCQAINTGVQLSLENDSFLARAEINWTTPAGKPHCVHIYEAYWAPITEGHVTYWETVKFLFGAAWAGIKSSRFFKPCSFQRYLFGDLRNLTIFPRTRVALLLVATVLLAQVLAIALVLAKLTDQLKQLGTAHFAISQIGEVLFPGGHILFSASASPEQKAWTVLSILGWYLLVAEIFFVRYFLIEYAGDVAAYISPYKASKFEDIRNQIQGVGLNVAKVIYGFDNVTPVPDYQRVVIAGHSLGSVLAYDTLNAIINLDLTSATPGSKQVVARTTKLITFGSPLDKTAFLFRNQSNHVKDPLREQMVSSIQPLILDYAAFRKPNFWTNLWSPRDVISGSLEYYDDPSIRDAHSPLAVENLKDPAGTTLFVAHVQYWTGQLLAKTLYEAVE